MSDDIIDESGIVNDAAARSAAEQSQLKPRPKGKIPYLPKREASMGDWRRFVSHAVGLPIAVRVDAVEISGPGERDPMTLYLSNGLRLRVPHQKQLHSPHSFQALFTSVSRGLCQPQYMSRAEVMDVYIALCVMGDWDMAEDPDPAADLEEHLDSYMKLCEELRREMGLAVKYDVLFELRARRLYDKHAAIDPRSNVRPVLVRWSRRGLYYIRANEWITYLRYVVGETVDPSHLTARMNEIGCVKVREQAWSDDRLDHPHIVFYQFPIERESYFDPNAELERG